jgi:RNA polymerase sigma-70 factor (ECF subfamily)
VSNNTRQYFTDHSLVERVLNGETNAFGIIIKNTENLVAKIVFDMIRNDDDRKDIAQDIYLKAYEKLPGFKFQSKLSTWIGQISYNTCIDHLRKKK